MLLIVVVPDLVMVLVAVVVIVLILEVVVALLLSTDRRRPTTTRAGRTCEAPSRENRCRGDGSHGSAREARWTPRGELTGLLDAAVALWPVAVKPRRHK